MNNHLKSRNNFRHLYDPSKEGLGTYDLNYINAYKKRKKLCSKLNNIIKERDAA